MGFSIQDYSDIQQIGRGGMSKVYLATQTSLDRRVVIKEMASGLLDDPIQVGRFENEARAAGALDHDNIIRIYDFGEDRGSFYIAMEYIDGTDLEHLLLRPGFPRDVALMIVLHALRGLAYAHQQGTIHRDVKPANIMISRSGAVKVLDFGLAFANQRSADITSTDMIVGTPHYISPEQANGSQEKDPRMDVWAAGVLLFRIVTGKLPFPGNAPLEVVAKIIQNDVPDLRNLAPTLPEELAHAINHALQKDRGHRLPTLAPLITALQNYFFEMGVRDTQQVIQACLDESSLSALDHFFAQLTDYHLRKSLEEFSREDYVLSKAHLAQAHRLSPLDQQITRELEQFDDHVRRARQKKTAETVQERDAEPALAPQRSKRPFSVLVPVVVSMLLLLAATVVGYFYWPQIQYTTQQLIAPSVLSLFQDTTTASSSAPETTNIASPDVVSEDTVKPEVQREPKRAAVVRAEPRRKTGVSRKKRSAPPRKETRPAPPPELSVPQARAASPARSPNPVAKQGTARITVEPSSARVLIDGRSMEPAELAFGIPLSPGIHTLSVSASGYVSQQQKFSVTAGSTHILQVRLNPDAPGSGQLHVYSYPWARIFIDGEFKGNSPTPKPLVLSEGTHTLRLEREGFAPYEKSVEIIDGQIVREKIRLE